MSSVNQIQILGNLGADPVVRNTLQDAKQEILDAVRVAVDAEPELPGKMPEELRAALQGDEDACTEALRIMVRLTKQGIQDRILATLSRTKGEDGAIVKAAREYVEANRALIAARSLGTAVSDRINLEEGEDAAWTNLCVAVDGWKPEPQEAPRD
ncbi:MAG TPA: hypothetical protein VK465_18995 [Fibrobacteria bacterium]|nr:hypothetical protein [Fibrobacteria bacterium]